MSMVVTGRAGFIGSAWIPVLLTQRTEPVVCADNLRAQGHGSAPASPPHLIDPWVRLVMGTSPIPRPGSMTSTARRSPGSSMAATGRVQPTLFARRIANGYAPGVFAGGEILRGFIHVSDVASAPGQAAYADISAARRELDFAPQVGFTAGAASLVAWVRDEIAT